MKCRSGSSLEVESHLEATSSCTPQAGPKVVRGLITFCTGQNCYKLSAGAHNILYRPELLQADLCALCGSVKTHFIQISVHAVLCPKLATDRHTQRSSITSPLQVPSNFRYRILRWLQTFATFKELGTGSTSACVRAKAAQGLLRLPVKS